MQNVRLKVERLYVVRVQGGVHMPEVSLALKVGKKRLSNRLIATAVTFGFWLFIVCLGFCWRGYLDLKMETLLSMLLWVFVYSILEEVRE